MNFLYQGTDGVRAIACKSTDFDNLTPQELFIKHKVISEEFVELYLYLRCLYLLESGLMSMSESIVIANDNRESSDLFVKSAISGTVKAGSKVVYIGVIPTPAVSLYCRNIKAAAGVMLTASHNSRKYNGIKIFTRFGLKLLPEDEKNLSKMIDNFDHRTLKTMKFDKTKVVEEIDEARDFFILTMTDKRNSLIEDDDDFSKFEIVVDSANGAASSFAYQIAKSCGIDNLVSVNDDLSATINLNSGPADFDSLDSIKRTDILDKGKFASYPALLKIFERADTLNEERKIIGAVLDGDADRLIMLEYRYDTDSIEILNQDKNAIMQAESYLSRWRSTNPVIATTVESDIGMIDAAKKLGAEIRFKAVGDRWLLQEGYIDQVRKFITDDTLLTEISTSADKIDKTINSLSDFDLKNLKPDKFLLGSESSGHTVSPTFVADQVVYAGNGIKSMLNSLKGMLDIYKNRPYPATLSYRSQSVIRNYIYRVDKSLFQRGSELWISVLELFKTLLKENLPNFGFDEILNPGEPDMLFLKVLSDDQENQTDAIMFIRKSGTENKISVNVRAKLTLSDRFAEIADHLQIFLARKMKDRSDPIVAEELELLEKLYKNPAQIQIDCYRKGVTLAMKENFIVMPELKLSSKGINFLNQ